MNIIVAGLFKAGSTALYNIVRIMLEEAYGKETVYSSYVEYFSENGMREHNLIKQHPYSEELKNLADLVFTTRRDLKEVVASLRRREGKDRWPDVRKACEFAIDCYSFWEPFSSYILIYEDYMKCPKKCVAEGADLLRYQGNVRNVLAKVEAFKKSTSATYGPENPSLVTANHITGSSVASCGKVLSQEELEIIDKYNEIMFGKGN
jgi:hypothetical protein